MPGRMAAVRQHVSERMQGTRRSDMSGSHVGPDMQEAGQSISMAEPATPAEQMAGYAAMPSAQQQSLEFVNVPLIGPTKAGAHDITSTAGAHRPAVRVTNSTALQWPHADTQDNGPPSPVVSFGLSLHLSDNDELV